MTAVKIVRLARLAQSTGLRLVVELTRSKHELRGYVVEANEETVTLDTEPLLAFIPVSRVRWIGLELA